jgi:exodeoxyribonuclease VII small subunit
VAKEEKSSEATPEYATVVKRLEEVVRKLEGTDLSLEDSLKAFEEGIRLVRTGETLLTQAEKKVEQLLSEEGEEKVVPLPPPNGKPDERSSRQAANARPKAPPADDDDVPF